MANPARGQISDQGLDALGAPVPTTRVSIWLAPPYAATPFTVPATILAAETGSATIANPFSTAADGKFTGWLASGSYDVLVEDTATFPVFPPRTYRWESQPYDKGIINAMLADDAILGDIIPDGSMTNSQFATGQILGRHFGFGEVPGWKTKNFFAGISIGSTGISTAFTDTQVITAFPSAGTYLAFGKLNWNPGGVGLRIGVKVSVGLVTSALRQSRAAAGSVIGFMVGTTNGSNSISVSANGSSTITTGVFNSQLIYFRIG